MVANTSGDGLDLHGGRMEERLRVSEQSVVSWLNRQADAGVARASGWRNGVGDLFADRVSTAARQTPFDTSELPVPFS